MMEVPSAVACRPCQASPTSPAARTASQEALRLRPRCRLSLRVVVTQTERMRFPTTYSCGFRQLSLQLKNN